MKSSLLHARLAIGLFAACYCHTALIAADSLPEPALWISGTHLEGESVKAELPKGIEGTVSGTVTSDGEGLVFDGTGGLVRIDYDVRGLLSDPFTVSALVESFAPNGYGNILSSASPAGFALRTSSHGFFSVSAAGEWNTLGTSPRSVSQAVFQHVVVVYDGVNLIIYLDGTEHSRKELQSVPRPNQQIEIGATGRETGDGEFTDVPNMRVAQLAIFDVAFTPEQVKELSAGKFAAPAGKP